MKIIETEYKPSEYPYEGSFMVQLITDTDEKSAEFGSGQPEDMNLARDLSDAYDIPKMLKLAYEAGKRGEDFSIESVVEED